MRKYSENDRDIANAEAWAAIVEDLLALMPAENRMKVLKLAVANEEVEIADRAKYDGLKIMSAAELSNMDTPGLRHWNAIMRLKSLVIQVFTRNITNNHSAEDAAKILFAEHSYGQGSGCLHDYISDLPGRIRSA
jgi:hypothetical protein